MLAHLSQANRSTVIDVIGAIGVEIPQRIVRQSGKMNDRIESSQVCGFNITAMRVVNAIPLVCGHQPGVISTFDLPPVTGRGRFAL